MFFVVLISLSLFLYLPNPVNVGISQLLPQLRAWGRVSVFLTMGSIALLVVITTRIKKYSLVGGALVLILVLLPFFEASEFRSNRPASVDISRVAGEAKTQRLLTLKTLQQLLPQNCVIFQVPIYPYPEFDRPDDSVGDYASILLPAEDYGYFKWSNPAIKNSYNWLSLQPLVSENPDFVRVSPRYSIQYAKALGACAVLIDRAMLTSLETLDFNGFKLKSECKFDLPGETFNDIPRFQVIELRSEFCNIVVPKKVSDFVLSNSSGKFLWKIDQAYGVEYRDGVQIFNTSSAINARVIRGLKFNRQSAYVWKISLFDSQKSEILGLKLNVCIYNINKKVKFCNQSNLDSDSRLEISQNQEELSPNLTKFEFTIDGLETLPSNISYWGVNLLQK
jgi:hypothetical protein